MKKLISLLITVGSCFALFKHARAATPELKPGDAAPAFSLPAQDGKTYSLQDLKGKTVILYFYPKDQTPGCTKEACAFRDRNEDIQKKGAVVLGINNDSLASHKKFAEKYNLNFPLLADTDGKVARAYGTLGMAGFVKRHTYVINPDGTIRKIYRDVSPAVHGDEILQLLAQPA
jgi:peroxiredoxin Q/BCP